MHAVLVCIVISHAILIVALLALTAWRGDAHMHLTARAQFSDWSSLLDVLGSTNAEIVAEARSAAWCSEPLPPGTIPPPFCDCITVQALAALNTSAPERAQAAWPLLSRCMWMRPPWRVWSVWKIQLAMPIVYELVAVVAFHLLALYPGIPWYYLAIDLVLVCVTMLGINPLLNLNCVIGIVTLFGVITWAVRPSLMNNSRMYDTVGMCFWWGEACAVPVFALYFLMLCTRDIVALLAGLTIATAIGTLSLRSFWYTLMLKGKPDHVYQRVRFTSWLAIVMGSVFFATLLPTQGSVLLSGNGTLMAMLMTLCIALSQLPTALPPDVLRLQIAAAGIRNVAFALLLVFDLIAPEQI